MKSFLNRKVQLAFGFAMLTLLLMGSLSYRMMLIANNSSHWVRHTHLVIESIKDLALAAESIESSSRGYVLTGNESDLAPYRAQVLRAEQDQATLRALTADNASQQLHFPTIEALMAERLQHADMIIAERRSKGMEAAVADLGDEPDQQVRDEFQAVVDRMQSDEEGLLAERIAETDRDQFQTRTILVFGTLLGILVAGLAAWTAVRDSRKRAQAEEELQQSEEKYRMLLDGVQDYAIFMLDPLGKVVSWSASAEHMKGYIADDIIGRNYSCFFTRDDVKRGRPEEILRLAATHGRHEEYGMRVRKDGTQFLAGVTFIALRDPSGNLRGFSEICRDLTEHKDSEAKYRGLLEAAPDGMVVVNQDGEIVLLNAQAEKQFGYRRDELLDQKVTNIIPKGFAERLIADGTRTAAEALAQQIGTGIELIGRRKNGSNFPIEIMLSPLASAEGILVTAAIRDITVRKDADKNLAQMEARYRGLLEAAPDGMVVVNQDGVIVLLNAQAEKRFGYRRDELLGQKVTNIIPKGFAERLIADGTRTAAQALAQQIGTGIELIGRRKNGSEFPIEIMLSPLESTEGILVTAALRDITVRKDADKNLAQMEARYRGLLEAAPDGMVVVNQSGEIVLLNAQAEKRFGYRRDELLGQKVTNIIPKGFAERLIADGTRTAAEALAQQIGTGIELIGLRKDGSEFPIEIMLSPLESTEGILVTAALRDISVRKDAEEHLVQMEGRYRGLMEAAPDGMVVVNQSGEIVLLNAQAENQFGYRRDELLGQKVTNIIPKGFAERLIADGTRTAAEALAQQIGTGIELIGLRKDRTEFPIEIMLSPLESPEGILVTAAIRKITVRKDAEEHLVQMEGRYRGLMEAAPDGMVVVNQSGEIVILNARAEKQFGYSRDELLGQKVTEIIPEGFRERLVADALRTTTEALEQQIGTGIELHGRRRDGTFFPIEIMLSPLDSTEGILLTAAIRDISERKQLARQLHQSQKMEAIGQLTGGIAHDFNNLLGVIIGNLDLLDRLVADNPIAAKRVQTAQKAAGRGADITRRLLVFSSNEELKPSVVLLGESIHNTIELAARALGAEIKITTHVDESVPPLFVDPAGLESALLNLVVNARDAMPKGGSIIISSQLQNLDDSHPSVQTGDLKVGCYVCVSVSDTGSGMSKETLERAFEPFFTTKPRNKGTGLGLAMVYGFVKQSGGTVHVYSELGHGTTVSFYLPLAGEFSHLIPASAPTRLSGKACGTVLVVDDEEDLLEVALAYLADMGLKALKAIDGASALEVLAQHSEIDLVVTDIVMPGGMNGVELVQRARVLRPDLKIIFSSGFPAEALAERSMPLVDGPLLRKPYQRAEFNEIVCRVMEAEYAQPAI